MANYDTKDAQAVLDALREGSEALRGLSGSELVKERNKQARRIRNSKAKKPYYITATLIVFFLLSYLCIGISTNDTFTTNNSSVSNNQSKPKTVEREPSVETLCQVSNRVRGYNGVNVRNGPGLQAPIIVTIENGAFLQRTDQRGILANGFYWIPVKILKDGRKGWIVLGKTTCN
jgi:hypothetical protein